jgi:anhydro-N-acetylmuramic acid kinase
MQELYIGLMSGTSMDAVDAALVDFSTGSPQFIAGYSQPLPAALKKNLMALLNPGTDEINRMMQCDIQVARLFADTVKKLLLENKISAKNIRAIGSHGQTIRHNPSGKFPFTLQIGDPNIIAEQTSITTVADFRRRDIAKGGQGAPLAPAFHNAVFRNKNQNRIVLNLGGIANITWLPAKLSAPVIGFDTGPANGLLDAWATLHLKQAYDDQGNWAASGEINSILLTLLLKDPYFKKAAPKSTGREYFNLAWLQTALTKLKKKAAKVDVQTTLCELTAVTISNQIHQLLPAKKPCEILVCGGGIYNRYLQSRLTKLCAPHQLSSTEKYGVAPQWVEAMAFAWLAWRTMNGLPGNLPSVTGASGDAVLGGVCVGK